MSRSLRYSEVVQGVRRFRPSDFLPYLAAYSADRERASTESDVEQWFPWAVAALAKESALRGNEFRSTSVDADALARLIHQFNASSDIVPGQSPASLLTPIMYEQFPYQESVFEEMARTHALLVHSDPGQKPIPWEELLGIGLDEAMRASHILHAWVVFNGGRYDPAILDMTHFQDVYERAAPRSEIEAVAALLVADVPSLKAARTRADEKVAVPGRLERYGFNPLKSHPLVDLGGIGIWAPQTMLVSRAFLGSNLYYRGLDRWGSAFTDGLGPRTERYVGRQLGLLEGIELYPEIKYTSSSKSIDWIWVTDAAVILVECKAARLGLDAQAGGDSLATVMRRSLGEGRRQIDRTARLIQERHPKFDHIPNDRPVVGMVTTAEQFYLAGTPFSGFASSGEVPATTLSLRDLEFLVTLPEPEAAAMVISHAHPDGEGGRFGGAFSQAVLSRRNPILEESWSFFGLIQDASNDGA